MKSAKRNGIAHAANIGQDCGIDEARAPEGEQARQLALYFHEQRRAREQLHLDRVEAIKMSTGPAPAADLARCSREARTLASLSHPNIVNIVELANDEGRSFIVMERHREGVLHPT